MKKSIKKNAKTNQKMSIEVKNLSKTFEKSIRRKGIKGFFMPQKQVFTAVNNISFSVKQGECIGFIGQNGAGKSTTIKMLTGILYPTSGMIRVAGMNPSKERSKVAYKIGCMFGQKSSLQMHLTAMDSFHLLGAMYDIPKTKLENKISCLINELEIGEYVNLPVRKLSLGQRMICEIAATLLHEPEILFLDEPTIGLDIKVKERVRQVIRRINEKFKTTIFLTSHDLDDIEKVCNRIIMIDNGKVVKDESLENLKKEYFNQRLITITYEEDMNDKVTNYKDAKVENNKITIRVDTNQVTIQEILRRYMKLGTIVDMETTAIPLTEVILKMYSTKEVTT